MNGTLARRFRFALKELRETLRDRRTIVTLLLMPVLVYPLLSMAMNRFLLGGASAEEALRIGLESEVDAEFLSQLLSAPESQPPDAVLKASGGDKAEFALFVHDESVGSYVNETALFHGDIDVLVSRSDAEDGNGLALIADKGSPRSLGARRVLVERLQWYLLGRASNYAPPAPLSLNVVDVGEPDKTSLVATIVPLVLVLMTITGAVYPAIDLTAGERERGTMEALMASPAPRFELLLSKYIAVVVVATLTAMVNLLAMWVTLWGGGLLEAFGGASLSIGSMFGVLGLLICFSGFFSAVLLTLTSFARSFKEAQAYLIPIMLLSIAPGLLSLMPGIRLAGVMSVVPLINIVLLTREVLSGTAMFFPAVMAVVSTIAYAAAALSIASSLFGTDAVDRTSQQSIGAFLRRPEVSSRVPSPALAALVMAVLVPIYFVVSNGLLRYLTNVKTAVLDGADDLSLDQAVSLQIQSMTLSAISLILVFGGVPLLASWFGKLELRTTFRLNRVKLGAILGAAIVGLGAWVFAHEAFVIADALGIGGVSESVLEKTKKVLEAWTRVPPWVLLATLALTPAVIEELCFRGFLFSAIGSVTTGNRTILITALLFGFFHVVTGNALLIERFIPSFLLGLLLGWIAHRTSSVIPGMALHFVHNGLLELLGHYHERLAWLGDTYATDAHLPIVWLGGATLIIAVGITLLVVSSRRAVSVETSDAA